MTPVASWLVCSTQDWVDWVSALAWDCCVLGQDTVPPPTLVYKWDPENLASGLLKSNHFKPKLSVRKI